MTNFAMIKKILISFILAVLFIPFTGAENRAYKMLADRSLYEFKDEKGIKKERIDTCERGDTVYATEETAAYIASKEATEGIDYLPVEYGGKRGYVQYSDLYPVKLSAGDTLRYLYTAPEGKRDVMERILGPARTPVMNMPVSYTGWLLIFLASLVGAGACMGFRKKFNSPALLMCAAVLLTAGSVAEILYMLAIDNSIWFLKPSIVGGWGKTILYFIIMSVAIIGQSIMFMMIWTEALHGKSYGSMPVGFPKSKISAGVLRRNPDDYDDEDDDDGSSELWTWVDMLMLVPAIIGVVLMIMMWVDYFMDNTLEASTWMWALAPIPASALCGFVALMRKGRIIEGIVYPMFFVVTGLGIAISIMLLSMMIILVAIVGFVVLAVLAFGLSALGAAFGGGERVTGYLPDGTRVTGTKDGFGNVRGDDGKTYKIN